MRIKSYFAATVEEAMRKARRELGDDAMLVDSHRAMPEAVHLGNYEVVFAMPDEAPQARAERNANAGSVTGPSTDAALAAQIQQLRQEVSRLALMLESLPGRNGRGEAATSLLHPWTEEVYSELIQADIDPEIAHQVAACLDADEVAGNPEHTARCLRQALAGHFAAAPPHSPPVIIALVGPAGSGKTLLAEKISAWLARTGRTQTTILAYGGSRRVWGWSTSSSSRSLDAAGNPEMLAKKIAEYVRKGPVIVDTPGLGPADDPWPISEALDGRAGLETHLVLPATAKTADLLAIIHRFAAFNPSRIAFTHLDESTRNGNLLTVASCSRLPVAFLSASQSIEQLEVATTGRLVALVLGDAGAAPVRPGDRTRRAAQASSS